MTPSTTAASPGSANAGPAPTGPAPARPAARISAIEPDARYPGTVRLAVGGALFCTVPAEVVAAERLEVGRPIPEATLGRLEQAAEAEAAYRTALRALELRPRARADLVRRLVRKGHQRTAAEAAVARAEQLGLLDDAAFARNYVETRATRGRGPARMVRDLLALGVARSLIDRAVADQWPSDADLGDVPATLAARRAAQLGDLPRDVKRRRLLAFLARRGFTGHAAVEAVGAALR